MFIIIFYPFPTLNHCTYRFQFTLTYLSFSRSRTLYFSYDLGLNPMVFLYASDMKILKVDLNIEHELPRSRYQQ